MRLTRRPFPLVLAAPSGAGKTSIARALVKRNGDVVFSVSATTRAPRAGERDGRDYLYVDEAEFDRMLAADELLEWAVVHGQRYGTPRSELERALAEGMVVLLDIDVQGARQVRATLADAVLVFVLPPGGRELERRLTRRASETAAERRRRLEDARRELEAASEFDYIVVNEDLDAAVAAVQGIIGAERLRRSRAAGLDEALAGLDAAIVAVLERE